MMHGTFVILLISLVSANTTKWGLQEDEGIPYLTTTNFDSFLSSNPVVFVKFYAPWCGHCKKMVPEYKRLVTKLVEDPIGIPVVKVDATVEKNIATKYGIKGYPSLKLFKNGEVIDYKGPRVETDMYNFVIRNSGASLHKLDTDEELKKFSKHPLAVLYILPENDEESLNKFKQLVEDMEDMLFTYTNNQDYAKSIGLVDKYNLIVVRDFDDGNKTISASEIFSLEDMKTHIENSRVPVVLEFDEKLAPKILGENRSAFVLFTDDYNAPEVHDFRRVAKDFKGLIYFALSKITSGFGVRLSDIADVARGPAGRIIHTTPVGISRYVIEDLSIQGIIKGIEDFRAGTLPRSYKSELNPPEQTGFVKNVIGNSFVGDVLNNDKYVFLEAYAPWCGHCKEFELMLEELAGKLAKHQDISIAKMDATKNEFPGLVIQGYPTLVLFKPGMKRDPVYYKGERSIELLTKFLEEHAGRKLDDGINDTNNEL